MKVTKSMQLLKEVYDSRHDEFLPQFSVECVILGFDKASLKVLLRCMDMTNTWILPWGLVHKEEDVDDTAQRVLRDHTALDKVFVKQFYLFGEKDRTDKDLSDRIIATLKPQDAENHWARRRFVSLAYYALVEYDKVQINPEEGKELAWFDIDKLPDMYVNHDRVVKIAIRSLRGNIGSVPIGHAMLPKKFTLPELRIIYESILGRELDRRNFQRKMLASGLILPLNETRKVGAHKSPHLYCFNEEKYKEAEENNWEFVDVLL